MVQNRSCDTIRDAVDGHGGIRCNLEGKRLNSEPEGYGRSRDWILLFVEEPWNRNLGAIRDDSFLILPVIALDRLIMEGNLHR